MAVLLKWDHQADNGAVNTIAMRYKAGNDTYHVRSLRVVLNGGSPDYGQYPLGYPYDAASSLGITPNLGQAYDGSGSAVQQSQKDNAYVVSGSTAVWYFPGAPFVSSAILYWDHAADIGSQPGDTSTGDIIVNGVDMGDFTTPIASAGWGSRSLDITAQWNGTEALHTSTADLYVGGIDIGDFTTPAAKDGWASNTVDITPQFDMAGIEEIQMRYKTGQDTYHVRNLRVEVHGLPADYGDFPLGWRYTPRTALGGLAHLGQAYDGSGDAAQFSNQTMQDVSSGQFADWYFPPRWAIGAVSF